MTPASVSAWAKAIRSEASVCSPSAGVAADNKATELASNSGMLANAVAVEALTAALIAINLRYKTKGAGIRIVGVPR